MNARFPVCAAAGARADRGVRVSGSVDGVSFRGHNQKVENVENPLTFQTNSYQISYDDKKFQNNFFSMFINLQRLTSQYSKDGRLLPTQCK